LAMPSPPPSSISSTPKNVAIIIWFFRTARAPKAIAFIFKFWPHPLKQRFMANHSRGFANMSTVMCETKKAPYLANFGQSTSSSAAERNVSLSKIFESLHFPTIKFLHFLHTRMDGKWNARTKILLASIRLIKRPAKLRKIFIFEICVPFKSHSSLPYSFK
jgi:hypothetical protein